MFAPGNKGRPIVQFQQMSDPTFAFARTLSLMNALPGDGAIWPLSQFQPAGTYNDLSGRGHHLTQALATQTYTSFLPGVTTTGAIGSYLERAVGTNLNYHTAWGAFCWFKTTSASALNYHYLMSRMSGGAGHYQWGFGLNAANQFHVVLSADGTNITTYIVPSPTNWVGNWHCAAVRYQAGGGNELRVYIDGTETVFTPVIAIFNSVVSTFRLGWYYDGLISLPAICELVPRRVLLQALYNSSRPIFGHVN